MWQSTLCRCDQDEELEVGEITLDYPGQSNVIMSPHKREAEKSESQEMWPWKQGPERVRERLDDATLLVLRMEEGTTAKACRQALDAGKVKKTASPQCLQKKRSPANTLMLASETHFGIPNSSTVRQWICVVYSTESVVICSSSNMGS